MLKQLVKKAFQGAGLRVEWRDPLAEQIPGIYTQSLFLPRVNRDAIRQLLYYREQIDRVREVAGDLVECGVSIGQGLLGLILLSEFAGVERTYKGYDSFAGFPTPTAQDGDTKAHKGYLSSPPEIVHRVLRDGGVAEQTIQQRVRLFKGFFEETLPYHTGRIALLNLDCDLYQSYKVCLEHLYEQVVPGGLILFDEYGDPDWPGARQAVDEFFAGKPEKPEQHRLGKSFVVKQS